MLNIDTCRLNYLVNSAIRNTSTHVHPDTLTTTNKKKKVNLLHSQQWPKSGVLHNQNTPYLHNHQSEYSKLKQGIKNTNRRWSFGFIAVRSSTTIHCTLPGITSLSVWYVPCRSTHFISFTLRATNQSISCTFQHVK